MQRSLYPDQVEVVSQTLNNTESSKIQEILFRSIYLGAAGVVSGLQASVSSVNNVLVDVSAGTAFSTNGERLVSDEGAAGLSLADYTLDGLNFVCVCYGETQESPQANAVDGTTSNTQVVTAATIKVFSRYGLLNVAASSDNLSVDALDRLVIVAVVRANGPGIALTSGRITNAPSTLRWATSSQPSNITGVTITRYSQSMPSSFAVERAAGSNPLLRLVYTVGTGQITLRAPGDTVAGTGVNISGGGNFTILSNGGTHSMTISVAAAALPPTGGPFTDDLSVESIYEPDAPMGFARDELHRSLIGSGLPTDVNPHGLAFQDLVGQSLDLPQTLTLGSGLLATAAQGQVPRLVTALNSVATRTLLWSMPITGTVPLRYFRQYLHTGRIEWTYNARWDQTLAQWAKDDTAAVANMVWISQVGISTFGRAAALAANWIDTDWSAAFAVSEGSGAPQAFAYGGLTAGGLGLTTEAGVSAPRFTTPFAGSAGLEKTLIHFSERDTSPSGTAMRMYRSNTGIIGSALYPIQWVSNAVWSEATNLWSQENAALPSMLMEYSNGGIGVYRKDVGAAPWAATSWDRALFQVFNLDDLFTAFDFSFGPSRRMYHSAHLANGTRISGTTITVANPGTVSTTDPTNVGNVSVIYKASGGAGAVLIPLILPSGAVVPDSATVPTSVVLTLPTLTLSGGFIRAAIVYKEVGTAAPVSFRSTAPTYDTVTASPHNMTIDAAAGTRTINTQTRQYYLSIVSDANPEFELSSVVVTYDLGAIRMP